MKKNLTTAVLAILAVPMTSMAADNSVYVSDNIGLSMVMNSDIDNMPENAGAAKLPLNAGFFGTAAISNNHSAPRIPPSRTLIST